MGTSLKVILTVAAIVAVASPVMAQPQSHAYAGPSACARARVGCSHPIRRLPPWGAVGASEIRLDDCVHVAFPQCDGDATQTRVDRP